MTQLTVSIENPNMLRDIKRAIKMIRGVVSVKAEKPRPNATTIEPLGRLKAAKPFIAVLLRIIRKW